MARAKVEDEIAGLAVLNEPARRALYFHVLQQPGEVTRDSAAAAVGIPRNTAGFHLDRLAEEGLLDVSYRRLSGRVGPGAGRPSKLYRRSGRELAASVPPRSYDLAAQLLATAVDRGGGPETLHALEESARATGVAIGSAARAAAGPRAGVRRLADAIVSALAEHGYAPEVVASGIRLRNCPFHALVAEHRELVCGMNLALIEGIVEGAGAAGVRPELLPRPGFCCVSLQVGSR
jgi:predicted ArsR family transcriptional regulator